MSDLAGAWTFAEALDFCRSLDLNYTIEVVDSQEPAIQAKHRRIEHVGTRTNEQKPELMRHDAFYICHFELWNQLVIVITVVTPRPPPATAYILEDASFNTYVLHTYISIYYKENHFFLATPGPPWLHPDPPGYTWPPGYSIHIG